MIGAIAALCTVGAASAAITVGTTIGFDFGAAGGDAAVGGVNFTQVDVQDTAYDLDGSGSTLAFNNAGLFLGVDGAHVAVADPAYAASHLNDFVVSWGGDVVVLTFAGLDDALTYDIQFITGATTDAGVTFDFTTASGTASVTSALSTTTNGVLDFTGLTTDGSGNLVFTSGGGVPGISAGTVTAVAVPEPSSSALIGLGGIALILRRRK